MRKIKSVVSVFLALTMAIGMSACGSTSDSQEAEVSTSQEATPSPTTEAENIEPSSTVSADSEENTSITFPMSFSESGKYGMNSFSSGRALVAFDANGTPGLALIDESGNALRVFDTNELKVILGDNESSSDNDFRFVSGTLYDGESICIYGESGLLIMDGEGNITYEFNPEENHELKFLAKDDTNYVVQEHTTSFSENGYKVYEIDKNGQTVSSVVNYEESVRDSITRIAPGIFYDEHFDIFNLNTGEAIKYSRINVDLAGWTDGKGIFYHQNGTTSIYICDVSETMANQQTWDSFAKGAGDGSVAPNLSFDGNLAVIYINQGIFYVGGEGYYQTDGTFLTALPSFPDSVKILDKGYFSGDYAPVYLQGADGKNYITLIDKAGNMKYDPTEFSYTTDEWNHSPNLNGYIFMDYKYFITPTGETMAPEDSNFDVSGIGTDAVVEFKNAYYLSGGFYDGENEFISLDGKTTLNSVTVGEDVKNDGSLLDFSSTSTSTSSESTQQDELAGVQYTTIKNFDITGKWKNVGSYTFGQVQDGAIIAFDGTHCNVFSPNDTYAFYQDGDNYKLECTSVLSTDTISFTVKIRDEDNIDIYYGSNALVMTRVD